MDTARAMLFHAKLPLTFWAEAVNCASYLRNRSPTSALSGRTPYELWNDRIPSLSNIRVFGCVSYVHVPNELRKKLDPKARKCIFVGYPEGMKGYKLFDLQSKRFIRSPSVHFCENEFHEWENHKNQYLHTNIDTDDADSDSSADKIY